jgi:hypothetical protein
MAIRTGNTGTLVFATSAWVGKITRIAGLSRRYQALNKSILSDTDHEVYERGDLKDFDAIECQIFWDQDDLPPFGSAKETVTITYPPSSHTTDGTIAGEGWIEEEVMGQMANNEMMAGSVTIRFTGGTDLTVTEGIP